jgi:hypothetical protein
MMDAGIRAPRIPGDASRFIRDVNLPDGTAVAVNQRLVKQWEIKNVGTVAWRNRFLKRLGPADALGRLRSAELTPIPDTDPGQLCLLTVELVAPPTPGSCRAEWKMVDATGATLLPNQTVVYVSIDVRYARDLISTVGFGPPDMPDR